jgi:DNA topoisomerase-1
MDVVVVESPAKAKTINRYLGSNYKVLASYGHVRDLPAKDGSVRPDQDFAMSWEVDPKAERHLSEITKALKGAGHLYLATDPDREGEAISWHVREILKNRKALEGVDVKRVVFHEITKDAVLEALKHPRELDRELVDAYLARRALDYLVGFTLSPVLWRKLPGSRSAGRVQSVALRLVCEREAEIEAFKAREYWTVEALFRTTANGQMKARLTHLDGRKLDRYDLPDAATANAAAETIREGAFHVAQVERKAVKRNPYPPFITSTLQQEASRKLGLGASRTMRVAQKLYEGVELGGETVGLITYMRTDSVTLAQVAVEALRGLVVRDYGQQYLPDKPRIYRSTAKNAQEAHEAIRPTDVTRRPEQVARHLDADERRLYELIWKRTVASAMESATLEQTAVDIVAADRRTTMRATGTVVLFDGFLKLYQEDRDDAADENGDAEAILPRVAEGESLATGQVTPEQHFTKPPPRYTEASLVKRLEELGIGRPSTYASILSVLQDRQYVRLESRRFIPEDRGRIVTAFLTGFFKRYVEYGFTADLEAKLDDISGGELDWKQVLRDFWSAFSVAVGETKDLTITRVIEALDEDLGPHLFPPGASGKDPRLCPACNTGRLGLKLGRHGAFIGCANYPNCAYTRPLAIDPNGNGHAAIATPRVLGADPATGKEVSLRKGPYGLYVQCGEVDKADKKSKPKRASLPKGIDPEKVDLEIARGLLSLPREVGRHPSTGEMITAGIGRFGPYLKHGPTYVSLKGDDDVLTIGLNRAVTLIAEKPARGGRQPLRTLGAHPDDGKPVELHRGRYGPYVKHARTNATLSRDLSEESVTLEQALALIAERAAKPKGGKRRAAAARDKAPKAAKTAKPAKLPKRVANSAKSADDGTGKPRRAAGGGD